MHQNPSSLPAVTGAYQPHPYQPRPYQSHALPYQTLTPAERVPTTQKPRSHGLPAVHGVLGRPISKGTPGRYRPKRPRGGLGRQGRVSREDQAGGDRDFVWTHQRGQIRRRAPRGRLPQALFQSRSGRSAERPQGRTRARGVRVPPRRRLARAASVPNGPLLRIRSRPHEPVGAAHPRGRRSGVPEPGGMAAGRLLAQDLRPAVHSAPTHARGRGSRGGQPQVHRGEAEGSARPRAQGRLPAVPARCRQGARAPRTPLGQVFVDDTGHRFGRGTHAPGRLRSSAGSGVLCASADSVLAGARGAPRAVGTRRRCGAAGGAQPDHHVRCRGVRRGCVAPDAPRGGRRRAVQRAALRH